jgi:hypothetical protein
MTCAAIADQRRFESLIAELLVPATLERSRRLRAPTYVGWDEYGRILKACYEIFPPEQILVCFTSDLEEAPQTDARALQPPRRRP